MAEIGFNLAVYAVPVVAGRPGVDERLINLGDHLGPRYLPPAPRTCATVGTLCSCGVRGAHRGGDRHAT